MGEGSPEMNRREALGKILVGGAAMFAAGTRPAGAPEYQEPLKEIPYPRAETLIESDDIAASFVNALSAQFAADQDHGSAAFKETLYASVNEYVRLFGERYYPIENFPDMTMRPGRLSIFLDAVSWAKDAAELLEDSPYKAKIRRFLYQEMVAARNDIVRLSKPAPPPKSYVQNS